MGYEQDPYGLYKKEKRYKTRIKELIKAYYETNKDSPEANKGFRRRISEYSRDWS